MKKLHFLCFTLLLGFQAAGYTPATKKTVASFLGMSDDDDTFCELRGVVSRVRNYDLGRLFISDGTGTVFVYNVFDPKKSRSFKALDVRMGDTLTVRGRRAVYDGRVIEMKNAIYVCHSEGPDHKNVEQRDSLDKNPSFRGKGLDAFAKWVSSQLKYPADAVRNSTEGRVLVSFTIGRDGSILYPKIIESGGQALDNEVLRVLEKAPKWKPGIVDKKPVRVEMKMPVIFQL